MNTKGFVSFWGIAFLIGWSLFFFSFGGSLLSLAGFQTAAGRRQTRREELLGAAREVLVFLANAPSPGADSIQDWSDFPPCISADETEIRFRFPGGITGRLTEISSRLNPKTDSLEFWRQTPLAYGPYGWTALDDWEIRRREQDFYFDWETFPLSRDPEDWNSLYTLYSPLSADLLHRDLVLLLGVQAGLDPRKADEISFQIEKKQRRGGFRSREELEFLLAGTELAGILQTGAVWNLNFISGQLLALLLAFPWGGSGVSRPLSLESRILSARGTGEILPGDLHRLLAQENKEVRDEFLQVFGTRSWFWKLELNRGGGSPGEELTTILRRIPETSNDPRFLDRIQTVYIDFHLPPKAPLIYPEPREVVF